MSYVTSLLGNNEAVRLVARRHFFGLLERIWVYLLLIVLILLVFLFGPGIVHNLNPTADANYFAYILLLLLIPLVFIFAEYLRWNSHVYVVTNYRVIDVRGLVNKANFSTELSKINDTALSQSFWGRIFGFGTLDILTGSDAGIAKIENIADPLKFNRELLNAKENLLSGNPNAGINEMPAVQPAQESLPATRVHPVQAHSAAQPTQQAALPPVTVANTQASRNAQSLRELDDLRAQGLINDTEYQNKRNEILRRI